MKRQGPLVSVVIPTYNRASLVTKAVGSALGQTYASVEVVVVDDGSTDDTRERLGREFGDDARVRTLHQRNGGPARARNAGFAEARGAYVALLDSDDRWHPWKLAAQVACMERHPDLGMTWTDMEMIDPAGRVADPAHLRTMYSAYALAAIEQIFPRSVLLQDVVPELAPVVGGARLRMGEIFSHMIQGSLVHTSTVLLRRERLLRVGGFDESLRQTGEDYDFHLRTCREGPVGFIDLPTIGYQTGMSDQIVRQSHSMARAFLTTLTETLARDGERIDLSRETITEVLAEANAWIAESLVAAGEPAQAAPYFKQSLRYRPWQPRAAVQLALCHLPPAVAEAVRWAYRNSRRPAEAGVAGAQS